MDIKNVREKFKHFGTLTVPQLAQVSGESKDDLNYVITEFLQRGKVVEVIIESDCGGGCGGCSVAKISDCSTDEKIYRWVK